MYVDTALIGFREESNNVENGKKNWYVADGYLPYADEVKETDFQGHEAIMLLNCNEREANVCFDIYFEDHPPVKNIPVTVGAERVKCVRLDHPDEIGDVVLARQMQYSLRIRSDVNIVVQYGRMDIAQPNLAYIGTMGYAE